MVFQSGALLPWLSTRENIALGLEASNLTSEQKNIEVEKNLSLMKINDLANRYPSHMSGGQRQRVGIARALAINPEVLLLDEPFSSLDEKTSHELHEEIRKIQKEMNISILMTTHKIEEAVTLSDRVIIIVGGKIIKEIGMTIPHPRRNQEVEFMDKVNEIRTILFAS